MNKKLYVMDIHPNTDTPMISEYELISKTKKRYIVIYCGKEIQLRPALARQFFFSEEAAKEAANKHMTKRIEFHEEKIAKIKKRLVTGVLISQAPTAPQNYQGIELD